MRSSSRRLQHILENQCGIRDIFTKIINIVFAQKYNFHHINAYVFCSIYTKYQVISLESSVNFLFNGIIYHLMQINTIRAVKKIVFFSEKIKFMLSTRNKNTYITLIIFFIYFPFIYFFRL